MEQNKIEEFLAKVEALKKKGGIDLSADEDLSIAVMDLISLEEHFFFTAMKTAKDKYFDSSAEVREMRKELLAKLVENNEGETWCASKHLLSAAMRLIEVGNKFQSAGKKEEAKKMFEKAYKIYSIFWALKLKLLNIKKNDSTEKRDKNDRLEDIISKLADCCNE